MSRVGAQSSAGPRIEVSFAAGARATPVTGMVYVAIGRDNQPKPIEETGPTGVPLFSTYVEQLAPGTAAVIGTSERGHPIASLSGIPAGEYWVQPFVNVYTRFPRADGHTVWMHMDQWEGQNWKRSPGNLYGEPTKVTIDPSASAPIKLVADKVIPPVQVPADTAQVKRIKIQSQILTKWWGHPIFLGATVLLPKDYDAHPDVHYPVNYNEGHFSLTRARRLRTRRRVRQVVARGRDAAVHLRLAPASVAVLRRFLRRELREQRTRTATRSCRS